MKRLIRLLLFVVLFLGLASAQTAVVTRNVNLRPDASTDNDPIEKLTPGTQVQLLEPDPTDGFYHVQAADTQTGWGLGKKHPQSRRRPELDDNADPNANRRVRITGIAFFNQVRGQSGMAPNGIELTPVLGIEWLS